MTKLKKIILFSILVIAVSIPAFSYWQDQQKINNLNTSLPQGIKIKKELFDYKVINTLNNYTFTTPKSWKSIEEVKYINKESKGYSFSSINLKGVAPEGKVIAVVKFRKKPDVNLLNQANLFFQAFELEGDLKEDLVQNKQIIKAKEVQGLMGIDAYFFEKEDYVYLITCKSEDLIKEIIINGKW